MKPITTLRFIALSMVICGGLLVAPIYYYQHRQKPAVITTVPTPLTSQQTLAYNHSNAVHGTPVRLRLPSIDIDLTVDQGFYDPKTGNWTISDGKAFFAVQSAEPNNTADNTLIYGHAKQTVFARLDELSLGSEATVDTNNGYRFYYTYSSSDQVLPSDTSLFLYKGSPRLTLQTCSGVFYQNRQLFYFDFTRYEKLNQTLASTSRI